MDKKKKFIKKNKLKAAILGASGYTGSEVLKVLLKHPKIKIELLIGNTTKGKKISDIFSIYKGLNLPVIISFDQADLKKIDVLFSCMPTGRLSNIVHKIPKEIMLIDLSADFRFKDASLYEEHYLKHNNKKYLKDFTYGLTEISRKKIINSNYIACPGCYPTSILLPLIPLIKSKIIGTTNIIIDSKSGISGAGRNNRQDLLFAENYNSIKAYGNADHRHIPEIEHNIFLETKKKVKVTFTPHIIPINRGIMSTIYVKGKSLEVHKKLQQFYKKEKFVVVNNINDIPKISDVVGSNLCRLGVFLNQKNNTAVIVSVIDNLIKGAAGQAIQNMNNVYSFHEDLGLDHVSHWP